MEFIARIFLETAATMLLLACVNSAHVDISQLTYFDSDLVLSADEAPPIPATYYMDYDSELARF
jgi:hypothetical protein